MRPLARFILVILLGGILAGGVARADLPPSPFEVAATLETEAGGPVIRFNFKVPPEHYLYPARIHFETEDGAELTPRKIQEPWTRMDDASGHESKVYDHNFAAEIKLTAPLPVRLVVRFQGCSNSACYFPDKRFFQASSNAIVTLTNLPSEDAPDSKQHGQYAQIWKDDAAGFSVGGRETGYIAANDFLAFLASAKSGHALAANPIARLQQLGLAATLLFILLGGLGLNLTPCVLPLIPINLAIIGAGARASSRGRGFALGSAYGAGMALAYGSLGLFVVVTGSKFGALNSSTAFNVAIAAVFALLALAMFDWVKVDFSRFQGGMGTGKAGRYGQVLLAFGMGVVASLLAGACVAPVVISVLLLSTQLYSQGIVAGMLLPFVLGLGMALPWPFAGAGLSLLPKPGRWMKWIKHGFGILILLFACYYGHIAYVLFQLRHEMGGAAAAYEGSTTQAAAANASLVESLRVAREEHRPVLIDFAATWCKNCAAMDHTVFNTAAIKQGLQDFEVVHYLAEQPGRSPARETLDYFGVIGLPTYVVLLPK